LLCGVEVQLEQPLLHCWDGESLAVGGLAQHTETLQGLCGSLWFSYTCAV